MSDDKQRPYCYVDHANKKSENYTANPYLSWLRQARRHPADVRPADPADDGEDADAAGPEGDR